MKISQLLPALSIIVLISCKGKDGAPGPMGAQGPIGPQGPAVGLSYKTYTALLTQTDTAAPVAAILENTLDLTITWSRVAQGKYVGALSKPINLSRSVIFFATPITHTGVKGQIISATEIRFETENGINAYDDNFTNLPMELKEYK